MNAAERYKEPFILNGLKFETFICKGVGDGIPMHKHSYNHWCQVLSGSCRVSTATGKTAVIDRRSKPVEFTVGTLHSVVAVTPGAIFQNIFPVHPDGGA